MKISCLSAVLTLGLLVVSPKVAHAQATSASNADGESDRISPSAITYQLPPAVPTNLRVTRLSATQNKIEWDHPGTNVTAFHLYRAKGNEEWDYLWGDTTHPAQLLPVVIQGNSRIFYDDQADADFPYRYVLKAANTPATFDNFSEPSNEAAEYSTKVTLLAGVGRTPLPPGHPQPTGTVSLTNLPGQSADTLNGPYNTYTPYGPAENGEQYNWEGSRNSFRKTGQTYAADVSVQTAGVLVVPDLVHPIYDIGYLFGDVGTGTTSSFQGSYNYDVAPDYSSATMTSQGQLAIFQGHLEPSPNTDLAYDFASNPRWLSLPSRGAKQVRFTLAPARPDLTKSFAIGGGIQVTPATTTQANQLLTLQSQDDTTGSRTLVAWVNTGQVAQLRVDVRSRRTLAVAVIFLTQDYSTRRGFTKKPIPPLNPDPVVKHTWPAAGQLLSQLDTFLNSIFVPQMNIAVTVTPYSVSKDYDCGVTDEFLDITDRVETDVLKGIIAEHSGFDKYLFFVHKFGAFGKSRENEAGGIAPGLGRRPAENNYCIVHDFAHGPLQTAAHEIGHTLGLRHIWDNTIPHRGYAPYDSYHQRIMSGGINRARFSQAEREIAYQALFELQNALP